MSEDKKYVVITGGAGFIGSHLCKKFLKEGFYVTALDNLVTGQRKNIEEFEGNERFDFLEHDITRALKDKSLKFIKELGTVDGVLHFACPASPVDFEKIPFDILAVDSVGTMNTVDFAMKHGARYVLASTSEIYGDPLIHPQGESYWGNVNTVGPRACYDETKRFAEAYVSAAARGSGTYKGESYTPLNGGIVRIFNTYGPKMRENDGRVVPEFCVRAIKGEDLELHGDGSQTRSFCYVDDLVEGIFLYYKSDLREPVNLGNPDERSIAEFAENVIQASASTSDIKKGNPRPDDPKRRCPDIALAKRKLNWEPKIPLHAGIARTIEYFRSIES